MKIDKIITMVLILAGAFALVQCRPVPDEALTPIVEATPTSAQDEWVEPTESLPANERILPTIAPALTAPQVELADATESVTSPDGRNRIFPYHCRINPS